MEGLTKMKVYAKVIGKPTIFNSRQSCWWREQNTGGMRERGGELGVQVGIRGLDRVGRWVSLVKTI